MSKRTASTTSDSPSLALNEHLSHSAQRQLSALRSALESRLAHLKEVLADPSRGESLAGLILDLSRVATEEAQAAAAQACIATKVEAENEIAALRASAKAALDMAQAAQQTVDILDQERAANKELRREVEEAQQDVERAQLETDKQSELLAARAQLEVTLRADRDRFEAEAVKQKSAAADLQRGLADAQRQLETERRSHTERDAQVATELAAAAESKRSAESATARVKTLEREQTEARAAHKALEADLAHERADLARERADLARERAAAADRARADEQLQSDLEAERAASAERERAYARLHSQLEAERASVADLKQAAARAEELGATLGRETSKGEEAREEIAFLHQSLDDTRQALTDTRQELDDARQALAAAQADLERERGTADRVSTSELRQAIELSDQQLASARSNEAQAVADHQKVVAQLEAMIKEREAVADELTAARKWINDLREAEAEFALPAAPKHVEVHAPKAKAKAPTSSSPPPKLKMPPGAGEEGWQAVRLANRYVFNTELMVQVNGDPARLFDLSISGCQLLSPTALKPNQMVKVLLPDKPPVTCPGKVVWTRLEPMGMGQPLGYRAGVRFNKVDDAAIETFAASHATPA